MQRRRCWSTAEKVRFVEEAMRPGMSVSFVARQASISPSQLFAWKRRMLEGDQAAVQADEDVVGTSRVRDLERLTFGWLATGGVIPFNPATAVRAPQAQRQEGQDTGAGAGRGPGAPGHHRRDHAGRLARSGPDRADGLFVRAHQRRDRHAGPGRLHPEPSAMGAAARERERGGKEHDIPCHHNLEE